MPWAWQCPSGHTGQGCLLPPVIPPTVRGRTRSTAAGWTASSRPPCRPRRRRRNPRLRAEAPRLGHRSSGDCECLVVHGQVAEVGLRLLAETHVESEGAAVAPSSTSGARRRSRFSPLVKGLCAEDPRAITTVQYWNCRTSRMRPACGGNHTARLSTSCWRPEPL